ncbi:hypothetical protein AVEN_43624-1 [Araneus ventricosus]|uniref:Uncharacterized protein n=1 Tax=Araneus ventricosus TaxID=182803 RepID=A0A4Y2BIG5_ARAVE|nr:hypothetical protein AVEN_43624-1 [Araneus ventricosus]
MRQKCELEVGNETKLQERNLKSNCDTRSTCAISALAVKLKCWGWKIGQQEGHGNDARRPENGRGFGNTARSQLPSQSKKTKNLFLHRRPQRKKKKRKKEKKGATEKHYRERVLCPAFLAVNE